ncbi:MAG: hypothetical protein WC525_10315 [Candidatus Thermoplasmatota archaeon]
MTLLEDMIQINPERNVVFTAIETLKRPEDIRRFMKEYEDWMLENGDVSTKGREVEVARQNVGYILGYFSPEAYKLWYGVLQEVSHPVFGHGFGRGKDPTNEEAFKMGETMGKNLAKKRGKTARKTNLKRH